MNPALIPKFSALLKEYYKGPEFVEFVELFGVKLQGQELIDQGYQPAWLSVAKELLTNLEYGATRRLVDALIEDMGARNGSAIANTRYEARTAHENLQHSLGELRRTLEAEDEFSEAAFPAKTPFLSKSHVRDMVATATTEIFVVDPYIDVGTLDCLRTAKTAIRLLASKIPDAFESSLKAFRDEGFSIEIRRAPKQLHDRHLCYNDRCWLLGSSLKDAGTKEFHALEFGDAKEAVVTLLEEKWASAKPFP